MVALHGSSAASSRGPSHRQKVDCRQATHAESGRRITSLARERRRGRSAALAGGAATRLEALTRVAVARTAVAETAGSTAVADTATNSLRVVKTFRQTSLESVTYAEAARLVVQSDGWSGLFGRGLATRLLANGFQAAIFSAMWKYLEQRLARGR